MNKAIGDRSFLFLTLLERGMNSFSTINKKMFFMDSNKVADILFDLQATSIISICKKGVYLPLDMYTVIQFINSVENDNLEHEKIERKEMYAETLKTKYKKSFDKELECLYRYV